MYFAAALENCSRRCCPWRGLDMVLSTTYQLQTIPPYWSWNDGHFWTRHLSKKELFAHLEPYSSIGHLQLGKILNIEPGWTLHIEMILNCIFSWGNVEWYAMLLLLTNNLWVTNIPVTLTGAVNWSTGTDGPRLPPD